MHVKRTFQIVLLAILLSHAGGAEEETLEARRQRIMRKYLQESSAIMQSDMAVPDDELENEQVLDSEKFQEPDVEFERHKGPVVPPRMPPRQTMVRQESDNWLLSDVEEEEDPFGRQKSEDSMSDYWSMLEQREDSTPYGSERRDQRYGDDRYDTYSRRDSGRYDFRDEASSSTRSPFGFSNEEQFKQDGYRTTRRPDIFGRTVQDPDMADSAQLQPRRTYGSSPDSGMLLNMPFSQTQAAGEDRLQEDKARQGYIPYKNLQQMDRERSQRWGDQRDSSEQIYTKPNPYQQYKERNKVWEPTADDAYLDEMIRKAHGR
ncbi:MAG: hypothetical protein HKP10_08855 [Kiritimatiellales bacterium]|nr:hypothetical protein [Pontiella sp.]NNJ71375.1 hypothetical protein [Kiritimatiellales bacterium]